MKKISWLVLMVAGLALPRAHAATCATMSAGSSVSAIQAAANSCGSGNTLALAAGNYTWTSTLNLPCGVSLWGPVVPYSRTYSGVVAQGNQTAHLSGPVAGGWAVNVADGCHTPMSVEYVEWNGNKPSAGGGGFIQIGSGNQNITVSNNWLHGNQANVSGSHNYDSQVWIEGGSPNQSDTPNQFNIVWNIIGNSPDGTAANGDCGTLSALFTYQGGSYDSVGGQCAAIGVHEVQVSNAVIGNNVIQFQEQGMKYYECGGSSPTLCIWSNTNVQFNDIGFIHRIPIEVQVSPNPNTSPGITYTANIFHDNVNFGYGSWGFSQANIGYNYDLSNVMIANNPPWGAGGGGGGTVASCPAGYDTAHCFPGAYEFWANQGNYSLVEGYWSTGYAYGYYIGTMSISNNSFCGYYMHNYNQDIGAAHPVPAPTTSGNVDLGATCPPIQSTAPSIAPGSGAQTFPVTFTVTNGGFASRALPQVNMGNWCTTDGSTPVPGAGTAFFVASGGTGSMLSSGTVKCKGMWGAQNQLVNYPTGYGFSPSAEVDVTYTGGTATVATPAISPAAGTYPGAVTVTITDATAGAAVHYTTDGSTPTSGSPTYSGAFSVTPTATVKAIGILSGFANSSVASNTYTFGMPPVSTPTFTPAPGAFTGQISIAIASATSGASLYYTVDGSTPSTGSTPYTGPITGVQASVTVKAIGTLSGYTTSAVGTGAYSYTTPTLTSGSQSNAGSVNTLTVGAPAVQQIANANYSDGTTRPLPDPFGNTTSWSSTNTAVLNVTSTGLVSCVGAGSAFSSVKALPGNVGFSGWGWTCNAGTSITGVTLAMTGGGTSLLYGGTNQIAATCAYSDGSTTNCTTADSHGNVASAWASSAAGVASVSSSGLLTAVKLGSTNITATAGGKTSNALPVAVISQKTLTGVTLGNTGSVTTVVAGGTIQFHAYCAYSNAATQDCSVTDIYGDAVTSWGTSASGVMSMNSSGLATGVSAGSANATAVVNGSVSATPWGVTVTAPTLTLTGLSLSTAGGVTGLFVATTNQIKATCTYSDGSTTNCTTRDTHGNVASSYHSSNPAIATISSTGLVTAIAPGTASFTASAGQ